MTPNSSTYAHKHVCVFEMPIEVGRTRKKTEMEIRRNQKTSKLTWIEESGTRFGIEIMDEGSSISDEGRNTFSELKKLKNEMDILSNLPADVLSHILSLLETADAVRTSVLSTKWKYMWTSITNLEFHNRRGSAVNFMNFVERVLLLLEYPVVERFCLSGYHKYDATRVRSWISAVIRRKVKSIKVRCPLVELLVLPSCVFQSGSLTELKLSVSCTLNLPMSILSMSNLKILNLSDVSFLNKCFGLSNELHFSFPVLEMLSFDNIKWLDVKIVDINAPNLLSFSLNQCACIYSNIPDFAFRIYGPNLSNFKFRGSSAADIIFLSEPSSIIDVCIDIQFGKYADIGLKTCLLLEQFSGLRNLNLPQGTVQYIGLQENLPLFGNLKSLCLGGMFMDGRSLMALLQRSPVLESLTFDIKLTMPVREVKQKIMPECLAHHLKSITFKCFHRENKEISLVRFWLKNSKVLEEMTIVDVCSPKIGKRPVAVKNQILTFRRGSDCVSIVYKCSKTGKYY